MRYTIDDVKARMEQSDRLRQFLPMLREYAFSSDRIRWLCTANEDAVLEYCAMTDE